MKPTAIAQQQLPSDLAAADKVGTFQTAFNMLKVFVGIGLLTTPAAFAKIGIVGGCVGMVVIGIIAAYTMQLQVAAKETVSAPVANYSELGVAVLSLSG